MSAPDQMRARTAARKSDVRVSAVTAGVLLLHAIGLVWLCYRPNVTLSAAAVGHGGQSVAVQLVSRASVATPVRPAEAKPLPMPMEKPRQKPPQKLKAPPVLTTQAASTQETQSDAPASPPTAAPTAAPAAVSPAVSSAASSAPMPASGPPTAAAAAPGSGEAALALKSINASEMAQLNCHIPAPVYSAKSRRLGQKGMVTLRLMIGVDGRIGQVRVTSSSGFAELDAAAVAALQAGRCSPYRVAGVALEVEAAQRISFADD
ncbi:TonB family protein [Herbaspirillum rubrisubalbicans]|nr:TonB family protein [Herbaspirillum rubrisubalbicans]